jgi:hypothetical protein
MAAGVVSIPWYATLFRGDRFAAALEEIAPVALRYGSTDYRVYRSRDDMYKFIHLVEFDSHEQWEKYWYGPEFIAWRGEYSSWYQVPVLYVWHDKLLEGGLGRNGNGHGNGAAEAVANGGATA